MHACMRTYKHTYIHLHLRTYIDTGIHAYIHIYAKMAEDVCEGIEYALNLIVSTAERSGNKKKELKQTVFDTVCTLRDLYVQLKTSGDSKSQTISDLEGRVVLMKADL